MDPRRPPQRTGNGNVDNRFHYPQSSRLPRPADPSNAAAATSAQPTRQFPPHPSVRVPPNVRTAARQVPQGVGVAPRPVKSMNAPRLQMPPPSRLQNNGQMVQDYRFPQAPPPIPASVQPQRSREFNPGTKYNMHDSYVSSIYENSPQSRTTPSSKSPARGAPVIRDSASLYPETEAPDSPQAAYPSSRAIPQQEFPPSPLRDPDSAYPSSRTTPHIATTELDPPRRQRPGEISPASSRTTAMNALSAAIAAGFSSTPAVDTPPRTPPPQTFSPVRMPFQQESRPRSADEPSHDEDIAPPELIDPHSGRTPMLTPLSAKSTHSTNPLLGLGINKPGMSSKVPVTKRPARLDIDAVRDMEARGSTTSLTELIRRATKLASNLDRGKTASRIGMLDFGSKEKLGGYHNASGNRVSTMSDMLSSFPAPLAGGTPRRDTMWPLGEKDGLAEHGDRGKKGKKEQRCCGMSLPAAVIVLVVLVLLIAAAVLVPIFLILVPKQHQAAGPDLSHCATTNPCLNGGTSIVASNNCQCICSNGFTGVHCGLIGGSTDCTTSTVKDGSQTYTGATMGKSIAPLFSDAQSRFNIPLNASIILSVFASGELSCEVEDTLVTFNTTSNSSKSTKRFVIVPGLEPDSAYNPQLIPVPSHASAALATPTAALNKRETTATVGSTNGIVFQTSASAAITSAAASTVTSVSFTSSTSSAVTPSATNSIDTSKISQQLTFAQLVVLYALQESSTIEFAVNAQQSMNLFFSSSASNETVSVGTAALPLTVNFKTFEITTSTGRIIGGTGKS